MRDWRFWALLGLFILVIALHLATPALDSDQAVTGLMGVHVLRGELPIFFWGQDHAGVPESYVAAVSFSLLGVSRLSLNIVPALTAVGLVLVVYRTAAVLFGHGAGLLAMLFATIVPPYVSGHYVLARAYYIEQLLLGQVVLLGAALALSRVGRSSTPVQARLLLAMGLAGGVGLYCGFQIAYALVPATLALLLIDPWLPRRPAAWLGAGAFLLGSAPFWAYNLTHEWATFATGAHFQGGESAAEAAQLVLFHLLPQILGVTGGVRTAPYLPWPFALTVPVLAGTAVALLALRAAYGVRRLRGDPARAGEALLVVTVATTVGMVWYGRFVQVARYLLPLAPVLAIILARACQLAWRRARVVAAVGAAAYLIAVGTGLARELNVLRPATRAAYWAARSEDETLFAFLRSQGLDRTYAYDYWIAPRLTFDARETIIVADPARDRYPPYTGAVDASPRPAYLIAGDVGFFEGWLYASQIRGERARVGRYTVFWGFTPPPSTVPVSRAGWTVRTGPGVGEPDSLTDGRIDSGWSSVPGPGGTAWLGVDLGRPTRIAGVTVVTDDPARMPEDLDVTVGDGAATNASPVVRLEPGGFTVAWRNGAPRTTPSSLLTIRFEPIETRHLRLTDAGPAGRWGVSELFVLAPGNLPTGGEVSTTIPAGAPQAFGALLLARRLEAAGDLRAALLGYREAMTGAPDDPEGYAEFTRLAAQLRLRSGPPAEQAARYARLGLVDEARASYARLAPTLGREVTHAELAQHRARLAARAGDAGEAERLEAEASAVLAPPRRVGAAFGGLVELTGFELTPARARPGESLEVGASWRLLAEPAAPLFAYTHFHGEGGRFGDDYRLPAPIRGLGKGPQHIRDLRRIAIPDGARPGRYRILVGVWEPEAGRHLHRRWGGILPTPTRTVEVGTFEVLARR